MRNVRDKHTKGYRRDMEGNERKSKKCNHETQKENNSMETRKKRVDREWKGMKRKLRRALGEWKEER